MNELPLTDKSRRRPPEVPDAWTAKSRHRSSRRELDTGDRSDAPRTAARFDAVAKAYLHHAQAYMTPRSYASRHRMVHGQILPHFTGLRFDEVDGPRIRAYLDGLDGVVGATRNRHQTVLSCIFRYAREAGLTDANPAQRVRRAREGVFPITVLDGAAQGRLLAGLEAPQRMFFMLLLDTGIRLGEALDLEWTDVDLRRGTIYIRRSKAKRPRLVGLSKRLQAELGTLTDPSSTGLHGHVFPLARAPHFTLAWRWRLAFKHGVAALGYPHMRVHDLRHLHAVNLVRMGLDLPAVQTVLGHTTLISTLRYAEYADGSAVRRAVAAIDEMHATCSTDGAAGGTTTTPEPSMPVTS